MGGPFENSDAVRQTSAQPNEDALRSQFAQMLGKRYENNAGGTGAGTAAPYEQYRESPNQRFAAMPDNQYAVLPDGMVVGQKHERAEAEKLLDKAEVESATKGIDSAAPLFEKAIGKADQDAAKQKEKTDDIVARLGSQAQDEQSRKAEVDAQFRQAGDKMRKDGMSDEQIHARSQMIRAWQHLDEKAPEYKGLTQGLKDAGLLDLAQQYKEAQDMPASKAISQANLDLARAQLVQSGTRGAYAKDLERAGRMDDAWKYERDGMRLMGIPAPDERPLPKGHRRA